MIFKWIQFLKLIEVWVSLLKSIYSHFILEKSLMNCVFQTFLFVIHHFESVPKMYSKTHFQWIIRIKCEEITKDTNSSTATVNVLLF